MHATNDLRKLARADRRGLLGSRVTDRYWPIRERPVEPGRTPRRLVFSPLAWLKLMLLAHAGDTEVGGFGVSCDRDPLYVRDVAAVKQYATAVTVRFDDDAVADHFDRMADAGVAPSRCGRIWVHTHPGDSATPSLVDEETFCRVFGESDWAVMAIVSRGGRSYARLSFAAGPGVSLLLPVAVDWAAWPAVLEGHEAAGAGEAAGDGALAELFSAWMDEYGSNVYPERLPELASLTRGTLFSPAASDPAPVGPVLRSASSASVRGGHLDRLTGYEDWDEGPLDLDDDSDAELGVEEANALAATEWEWGGDYGRGGHDR